MNREMNFITLCLSARQESSSGAANDPSPSTESASHIELLSLPPAFVLSPPPTPWPPLDERRSGGIRRHVIR